MLRLLKLLFVGKTNSALIDISSSENETIENKKCKNCLRRIKLDYIRCPFCSCSNFCFD